MLDDVFASSVEVSREGERTLASPLFPRGLVECRIMVVYVFCKFATDRLAYPLCGSGGGMIRFSLLQPASADVGGAGGRRRIGGGGVRTHAC